LTHVGQDAAVKSPTLIPVAESETEAFRAEARFFLDKIGRLTGLSRAQAVEEVAKDIRLPGLLSMVLEATWTLGAVFTTLFLGGWHPLIPGLENIPVLGWPLLWFLLKSYVMFGVFTLVRFSMPRFPYRPVPQLRVEDPDPAGVPQPIHRRC